MEQIQTEVRTSRNSWQKNKKTLILLISTIVALVAISVVYIIIFPKL
ncbi:MAG: hypothetical protein Q8916_08705 [Bacteroidota bacterium]|nr:hypothetical protein [Bacteroidota bacterium]MDP4230466.1 hypothetical protein [Bacteroidota bacterium]MDP4237079.1 hypothetical protein [Bacteroidota bacterium]